MTTSVLALAGVLAVLGLLYGLVMLRVALDQWRRTPSA